jgi:hypothetical protein
MNTAAVGIFFFCSNLGSYVQSASYIEVLCCQMLYNHIELHVVTLIPLCVFGLFLKPAPQKVCL